MYRNRLGFWCGARFKLQKNLPDDRIHTLKAKALLSGSDCGRGFGSVFRHQSPKPEPVSGFFVPARNASAGGVWRKALRRAGIASPAEIARFRPEKPLRSLFA
jgi:hypothetical protein